MNWLYPTIPTVQAAKEKQVDEWLKYLKTPETEPEWIVWKAIKKRFLVLKRPKHTISSEDDITYFIDKYDVPIIRKKYDFEDFWRDLYG